MTNSVQSKTINFPSLSENIALVEGWVDNLCDQHNVGEDHYGNILIAVTEAVTNAIQHGNKQDPTKNVDVTIDVDKSKIAFLVKDQGEGFNPENLPDPTDPENLEKPNGRGIFLMKNLADEVLFHDDGRTVELSFDLAN